MASADSFFRDLQRLLVEGDFASTYKHALLLALTRWAVEHPGHDEREAIDVGVLAPYFVEAYWPQVRPFVGSVGGRAAAVAEPRAPFGAHGVLVQDPANRLPRVVLWVLEQQRLGARSLADVPAERRDALLRDVRTAIREQPLWKLQKLRGGVEAPFLYQRGDNGSRLRFLPGVVQTLAAFAPLVEQIVRAAWLRFVLRHNQRLLGVPPAQLEDFLFPTGREALHRYRDVLLPVDGDRCFYCERAIRGEVHVDHFLPWSLYARDLGHNFVLAHRDCNLHKKDHLAARDHLARWTERNERGRDLTAAFDRASLPHDWPAVRGAARSLYGIAAATETPVWQQGRDLVPLAPDWQMLVY